MKILLTNDDGIESPGLAALHAVACRFGEAIIVAPDAQHSMKGHAVTTDRPLQLLRDDRFEHAWRCDGTPADCVRLGLRYLEGPACDVVMSGINLGANLGSDLYYSGTMAAAREAALLGTPGIAFSKVMRPQASDKWSDAVDQAEAALKTLWQGGRPLLANVNLPGGPATGIQHSRMDTRPLPTSYKGPHDCIRYDGVYFDREKDPTRDTHAAFGGWITMTVLQLDLTRGDFGKGP
jgi:5'-nucleotidase